MNVTSSTLANLIDFASHRGFVPPEMPSGAQCTLSLLASKPLHLGRLGRKARFLRRLLAGYSRSYMLSHISSDCEYVNAMACPDRRIIYMCARDNDILLRAERDRTMYRILRSVSTFYRSLFSSASIYIYIYTLQLRIIRNLDFSLIIAGIF